jgi:hypothetical protein
MFTISFIAKANEGNFVYTYFPDKNISLSIIERVNLTIFPNLVQDAINKGKIKIFKTNNDPNVQFIVNYINPGDKILLNTKESITVTPILQDDSNIEKFKTLLSTLIKKNIGQQFYPFVGIRQQDRSKYYGLLKKEDLYKLTPDLQNLPLNKKELLQYPVSNKLTIIYAFCPKDRKELCTISIRHHAKWVLDHTGNIKKFNGLALSEIGFLENKSLRIAYSGDTPQGIYGLWASMFSSQKYFGCLPRIDIDLNTIPINGHAYNIFSYLLEDIIPSAALEDYWVNELALAYAMGRNLFRIHANPQPGTKCYEYKPPSSSVTYTPSTGCLVVGDDMSVFFATLVKLGIFTDYYSNLDCNENIPIQWHAGKQIGKAFLIVKDTD